MSKKHILIWVFFTFAAIFSLMYTKKLQKTSLDFIVCDVGQGDAIIISYKTFYMVIDSGPNRKILECLDDTLPFWDRTIDFAVVTHQDADHIGGFEVVLNTYKVDQIMSSLVEKSTKTSKNFWKAVRDSKTQVIEPEVGRKIVFDELSVEVLWPEKNGQKTHQEERDKSAGISGKNASRASKKSEDTNAQSIVLRLEFGGFSALLTGDLEIPQEKTLITSGKLRHVTVLKVGHHGSNTSTSEEFLEEITPSIAVIGVGKDNRYGHPVKRVIDLLEEKHIHTLRTDLDGRITLTTDGKTIKESTSGKSHGSVIR